MSNSLSNPQSPAARLVGHEYEVTLAYTVEYTMTVLAGPYQDDAIEEAELLRAFGEDVEPTDRDLVHTDVTPVQDIFEDDPQAHEIAEWVDAPSAPSEDTYWDDTRHFGEPTQRRDD